MFGCLSFKCQRAGHHNRISYSRRLAVGQPLVCMQCLKSDRERIKYQMREEEQQKQSFYARMQAQEF